MEKTFNVGEYVMFQGNRCVVTRRNSMTLSSGKALNRYNLRGKFGTFVDILGEEVTEVEDGYIANDQKDI